ncbi:hypothetical protein JAAARDRAFT_40339 [Jaapia argillacea MUCL 33604]|uniref:Uncharacterized protein n=1 Tax=Jaapia argillacea MUCL 33604 TaxID=933084 RepID=A0A067PBB6_9AGAM|nr:hypothetical protein JAAARDRAFT_40339 [Jaapia argillacea MUCL 33604]
MLDTTEVLIPPLPHSRMKIWFPCKSTNSILVFSDSVASWVHDKTIPIVLAPLVVAQHASSHHPTLPSTDIPSRPLIS